MSIASGGKLATKINTSALADGDSIAAYLTDSAGALLTSTLVASDQALDVNVVQSALPADAATETSLAALLAEVQGLSHAEDAAHSSGDMGVMALAVRSDAGTAFGADGDYVPFSVDASNRLRVVADLTAAFDFIYAEDDAHASGATGAFVLAVRNSALSDLTGTDGDYSPFAVDAKGRMLTVFAGIYAEDSAHTDTDSIVAVGVVRKDSTGSNVGADGDYATPLVYASGDLRVTDIANGSVLQQAVTVGTTAVQIPASSLSNRRSLFIQNSSSTQRIYIGSATVTSSGATKGIKLEKDGFLSLDVGPSCAVYAISSAASGEVTILEAA